MLVIRMQRTGRKGYAEYRIVVQDSKTTPTSGRVVALLGNYNPHTKQVKIDAEKAGFYIKNGAQPSDRVVKFLKDAGVKLPTWAKVTKTDKKRPIKNLEKLRKNRPTEEVLTEAEVSEQPETPEDTPIEAPQEEPAE